MKIFIVYCHPSKNSFTHNVYELFLKGLKDAGHTVVTSDLYEMKFQTDLTETEYLRETFYKSELPVAGDVRLEQEKIQSSDAIAFIYPVFWTDAPAKLVGWFDRVWTTGFAYNPAPKMNVLEKALVIACAGKTLQSLDETGEIQAMKTVMLGDRIRDRAKLKEMVVFDNITHWDEKAREHSMPLHLSEAYNLGLHF